MLSQPQRKVSSSLFRPSTIKLWSDSLWLGPDHLLAVKSRWVTENYKRFYYRDIQAIIIRGIEHWKTISIILGSISTVFFLLMLVQDGGWAIFFGVIFGLFLIVFLYYLIWGANCESYIKTAVQIERLPAIYRLRTSSRAMNILLPWIDDAQGRLNRETIMENRERSLKEPRKTRAPVAFIEATPLDAEKGFFHTLLFILLFLYGIENIVDMFYNHIFFSIIGTIFSLSICAAAIIALVRQHNSRLPGGIKKTTWLSIGYIFIDFSLSYILMFVVAFTTMMEGQHVNTQWDMIKMASEISPFENPLFLAIYIFSASGALVLGVLGLYFILKMRTYQKETY